MRKCRTLYVIVEGLGKSKVKNDEETLISKCMEGNHFESEDAHKPNTFSRKRQSMDDRATPLHPPDDDAGDARPDAKTIRPLIKRKSR